MTQMLYTDNYLRYNVTYEILGKRSFYNNKNYGDMSGYTVILITDDMAENTFIRNMADLILTRGCKNIVFCGENSEEWQDIFDLEDQEINGFNDMTGYEDFAVTRKFEDLEDLPDEIESCWNDVLIICGNRQIMLDCREILEEAG